MSPISPTTFTPVSPLDMTRGSHRSYSNSPPQASEEKGVTMTTRSVRTNSTDSKSSEPRRARFAEATTVNSPAVGDEEREHRLPWSRKKKDDKKPKVSDVGFGYLSDNNPVEQHATLRPDTDAPLKSALKTPGTAGRLLNPLSPTFREEQMLEKEEDKTEVQQAKDLKVKTRVRMAKMVLRCTNFSCSLIVLSMLSTTFTIFNATRHLPPRNNLPAWATTTKTWPQYTVLAISIVSLVFSVVVIAAYWGSGHRGATKTAMYYSIFAVGYFAFSTVMWLVAAGILHGSKATGGGQDMWGWSCKDNKRKELFQNDVHYALVCRLQNWSLVCCIIEVVVELITIAIYSVVFYRFYSKNKLRKSMDARDKARSDLYLAQLKAQSAPNTPGYYSHVTGQAMTPRTPGFPTYQTSMKSPAFPTTGPATDHYSTADHYQSATTPSHGGGFKLQAPPIRVHAASPRIGSAEEREEERENEHMGAAPGEQTYDAVPIPGAYKSPINATFGQH